MSLTVEEIRKRVEEDKMHVSTLMYVQPLLDRIDELEKAIIECEGDGGCRRTKALSDAEEGQAWADHYTANKESE